MRKIIALYLNELIKVSRKVSVLVLISIMVIGVVVFGGFMKMQDFMRSPEGPDVVDDEWAMEQMKSELENSKSALAAVEAKLANASAEEKNYLESEKAYLVSQVQLYTLGIEKEISIFGDDYRSDALNTYNAILQELKVMESVPEGSRTGQQVLAISQAKARLDRYLQVMEAEDYRAYLDIQNEQIQADTTRTAAQKQIAIESNELRYKMDPTGGISGETDYSGLSMAIGEIEILKLSLLDNIDYTMRESPTLMPLTPKGRTQLEDQLTVLTYRLEHGQGSTVYSAPNGEYALQGMFGFGSFIILIMMMILAGGSVSQEIATGSIKSLIISPTRRWKIFLAKVLSLLTVGLAALLILYVVVILVNGLLNGFDSGLPYVFASNGAAVEINFYLYRFLVLLVGFIEIIVYMALALMLSVITRNTAAAVGISIAVYFGGRIANSFIMAFSSGEWTRFIPFSNISLTNAFFPFDIFSQVSGGLFNSGGANSLPFSLVYVFILLVCLGYTALDSFNRRDIK